MFVGREILSQQIDAIFQNAVILNSSIPRAVDRGHLMRLEMFVVEEGYFCFRNYFYGAERSMWFFFNFRDTRAFCDETCVSEHHVKYIDA